MKRLLAATLALGAVLGASSAQAATTTTQSVQWGPGPTDFSGSANSFALFDSNIGTLQSVTISISYGYNSSLKISATSPSKGSAKTESAAGFTSSNSSISNAIIGILNEQSVTIGSSTLNKAAFDLNGGSTSYDFTATTGGSETVPSNALTSNIGPVTNSTAAYLTAFSTPGGGNFNVLFNTVTGTDVSATGGNATASQTTTATGTMSLYYTYSTNTVPEPASLALLGVGIVGLGVARRRRKA